MKITRDSILFYIFIGIAVLVIIGGFILALAYPVSSLYIILEGSAMLFLWFGITESKINIKKTLMSIAFLMCVLSSLAYSYFNFQKNQPVTASLFALLGIIIVIFVGILKYKNKRET